MATWRRLGETGTAMEKWRSLFVSMAEMRAPGLYTFLPMAVDVGPPFWGFLHAAFFTKLDRTHLNPEIALNEFYFRKALDLAADLVIALRTRTGAEEALRSEELRRVVPDLCAWDRVKSASGSVIIDSAAVLKAAFAARQRSLQGFPFLPVVTAEGPAWASLEDAWHWDANEVDWLTAAKLSELADVAILDAAIGGERQARLVALANRCDWNMDPDSTQIADWLEDCASALVRRRASVAEWVGFYGDLPSLFRRSAADLGGKKILLCSDGKLRAGEPIGNTPEQSGTGTGRLSVSFPPKQGNEDLVRLPKTLSKGIAFVSDDLDWYGESLSRARTFLTERGLVRPYNTAELIAQVERLLVRSTSGARAIQALQWVFRLHRSSKKKGRPVSVAGTQLKVPTAQGGWILASEAFFSEAWGTETLGPTLRDFLSAAAHTAEELQDIRDRLLAPPNDPAFRVGTANEWLPFLIELGVVRGLVPMKPKRVPKSIMGYEFSASRLLEKLDLAADVDEWERVIALAGGAPSYGSSLHEIDGDFWYFPGQGQHGEWADSTKELYARLVLEWLPSARDEHFACSFFVPSFRYASRFSWPTPLAAFFRSASWVPLQKRFDADPVFSAASYLWLVGEDAQRRPSFLPTPPVAVRRAADRQDVGRVLRQRCGANLWDDPESLAEQARFLGELLSDDVIAEYQFATFANVYERTWKLVAEHVESLDWGGRGYLVVRRGSALVASRLQANTDPAAGGRERIFIRDTEDELVVRLLQAAGRAVFDIGGSAGKAVWKLLRPVVSEQASPTSEVEIQVFLDEQELLEAEKLSVRVDEAGPFLPLVVLAAAKSLSGAAARSLPANVIELASRLHRLQLVQARKITFHADGTGLELGDAGVSAFALPSEAGGLVLLETPQLGMEWSDFVRIAVPIAELLHQPALAHPLKNALRSLERRGESTLEPVPSAAGLSELSSELGLESHVLKELLASFEGAAVYVRRELRPLLQYWGGDSLVARFDKERSTLETVEAIEGWMAVQGLPACAGEILAACQAAADRGELRERLELDFARFNAALVATGEPPLKYPQLHEAAVREFIDCEKEQILGRIRTEFLDRWRGGLPLNEYVGVRDGLAALHPPAEWLDRFKFPPAEQIQGLVLDWLRDRGVHSLDTGSSLLPLSDVRRKNRRFLDSFSDRVAPVVRAWAGVAGVELPDLWQPANDLAGRLASVCERRGWLDFELVDDRWLAPRLAQIGGWPQGMPPTTDAKELGISHDEVEEARSAERVEQERLDRMKRSVEIGGRVFDPDALPLEELLSTISDGVNQLQHVPAFGDHAALSPVGPTHRRGNGRGHSRGKGRVQAVHPAKANLIGFIGEYAVYEWLKRQFPDKDVDSAWVSGNRSRVFPGDGDDTRGYDFELLFRNRTWYIEVKAHIGDPLQMELGESEVRVATECSRLKTKEYMILYVSHVEEPSQMRIDQLPNPFELEGRKLYRRLGEGLRYGFDRKES